MTKLMPLKKKIVFQTTFATYTASDLLGEGGAGRIYKVEDDSGGIYALKLLRPENITKERLLRFKHETLFSQRNQHKNILTVFDHGLYLDDGKSSPFYVMPYYDSSLRKLVVTGLSPEKILPLFSQIIDGVEAAHLRKVIHRDLKPENILYSSENDRIVVADFGIAQFQEETLYTAVETKAESRLANFQYAAPEQKKRGAPVDVRTDIYALGLILNEMFTREIPSGSGYKTIASISQQHSYLDGLVALMIRQMPSDRAASIEIIKRELIGRNNEFIERQSLSEIRNAVIPETEIDDPLVYDPPKLVDFDWKEGVLTLFLSRPVNSMWHNAFMNIGSYTSVSGKGPDRFDIKNNEAKIPAREQDVEAIIDYFKSWLPRANSVYEQIIREQKRKQDEKLRQELRAKIEEEEARERLRKKIRL